MHLILKQLIYKVLSTVECIQDMCKWKKVNTRTILKSNGTISFRRNKAYSTWFALDFFQPLYPESVLSKRLVCSTLLNHI